jgi:hypothetical protein
MRAVRSDACVARLRPGEVKRIPRPLDRPLVGYYLACPVCGRVQAVPASERGFEEGGALSMRPAVTCARRECAKSFSIERDEFIVSG